jgi:poly-beta-hydroxyalkanoate depolymerase
VGHYGSFNGGYFRQAIGPLIRGFIRQHHRGRVAA